MTPGQHTVKNVARLVAEAGRILRESRQAGLKNEGVIAVIVAARLLERDMREMCERIATDALFDLLEQQVRVELEKMGTAGWARN